MINKNEVFKKEWELIINKYLNNIKVIGEKKKVKNRPCTVQEFLYNDKEYLLYDYSKNEICNSYMFIPKYINFEKGIYDNIINLEYNIIGFHFAIYSFLDNTIKNETYDFILEGSALDKENNTLTYNISHYYFDKKGLNILHKQSKTDEIFFKCYPFDFRSNLNNNLIYSHSIQLLRNDIETKSFVFDHNNDDDILKYINGTGFEHIDDNTSPLFELLNKINLENTKK